MEEPALLLTVKRIVAGVKVQDQKPRSFLARGAQKRIHEVLFQLPHFRHDLLVARPIVKYAARGFQSIQRAIACKSFSPIPTIVAGATLRILFPTHHRQKWIATQSIMIDEILIIHAEPKSPLGQKFRDAMLDKPLIAEIVKARGKLLDEATALFDLPQKKPAGHRR